MFYQWSIGDFKEMISDVIAPGDEIISQYSESDLYEAIPVESVTCVPGEAHLFQYPLPDGAWIASGAQTKVNAYWQNGKHVVRVSQIVPRGTQMLVRRK